MTKAIFVEFAQGDTLERISWNDRKTGEAKTKTKQPAYLHGGGAYPIPFKVEIDENGPFRAGLYMLAGDAFKIGDFEALEFKDRNFKLIPLDEALGQLSKLQGKSQDKAA